MELLGCLYSCVCGEHGSRSSAWDKETFDSLKERLSLAAENDALRRVRQEQHGQLLMLKEQLREKNSRRSPQARLCHSGTGTFLGGTVGLHHAASGGLGDTSPATPQSTILNETVKLLWPRVSDHIMCRVLAKLEVEFKKRSWPLCRMRFVREQCSLDTNNPDIIHDMSVVEEGPGDERHKHSKVVVRLKFGWDGNCTMTFRLVGRGVGLGSFNILFRGLLLAELVGIMDKPPFFAGLRLFFPNPPALTCEFEGATKVLNLYLFKKAILNVISEKLSQQLVLPNLLGVRLYKKADLMEISTARAKGIIWLTVWRASDLLAQDFNLLSPHTSDPFVEVTCGTSTFRSTTQWKTCSPTFTDEDGKPWSVPLVVTSINHQFVSIELFDRDPVAVVVKPHDFLGHVSIRVQEMLLWDDRVKVELQDASGVPGRNGAVELSMNWQPATLQPEAPGEEAPGNVSGLLLAGVHSAYHVPFSKEGTEFWVEMECTELQLGQASFAKTRKKRLDSRDDDPEEPAREMFEQRKEVLKRYNVPKKDIAKLFLDREHRYGRIKFAESCEFHLKDFSRAEVTFTLCCSSSSSRKQVMGSCRVTGSMLWESENYTFAKTIQLLGTSTSLRLHAHLRFLGAFQAYDSRVTEDESLQHAVSVPLSTWHSSPTHSRWLTSSTHPRCV